MVIDFATPSAVDISSLLDGVGPGPSAVLPAGTYIVIAMSGAWPTPLTTAPTTIVVGVVPHSGGTFSATITCALIAGSQTGSWPV